MATSYIILLELWTTQQSIIRTYTHGGDASNLRSPLSGESPFGAPLPYYLRCCTQRANIRLARCSTDPCIEAWNANDAAARAANNSTSGALTTRALDLIAERGIDEWSRAQIECVTLGGGERSLRPNFPAACFSNRDITCVFCHYDKQDSCAEMVISIFIWKF
jgi:hypothetical protein